MANRSFWLEIVDKLRDWIDNRIETKGGSLDAQYDRFANTRAFTSVHNRTGYLLETEFYGYVTDFGDQFLDKTRKTTPSYDDFRMEIRKGRLSSMQQMIDNFPESVSDADKELYSQFLKDNVDFSIADEGSMQGLYGLALDYNIESTQRYVDGYFEANKLATKNKLVEKYGAEEYNRLYGLLVDRNSPSFGNFEAQSSSKSVIRELPNIDYGSVMQSQEVISL